jgi:hypothetical protein
MMLSSDPFGPVAALMAHVTTEARTSYPLVLCWGNAIWAMLAFRKDKAMLPAGERPSYAVNLLMSFTFYGMFANFAVNMLCFGRSPSALHDATIIPVFLVVSLGLLIPYNLFERFCGATLPFFIVDTLSLIDATTTMFNNMEAANAKHKQHHFTMLVALMTYLGGGITRHFIAQGFVKGCATLQSKYAFEAVFVAAVAGTYYYAAILKCDGDKKCLGETGLYEQLAWVVVARNAYDNLPENKYAHGTSFVKKEMDEKRKDEKAKGE